MDRSKQFYCTRCKRTKAADNFYTSNNLEKYPDDGKMGLCKECQTAHIDNWNPDTFVPILQEIDVPYVPSEWNTIISSITAKGQRVGTMSVLGRYLSRMKLKQYKDYRFADSETIMELKKLEIEQTMKRQGYSAAEIAETLATGVTPLPPPPPSPIEEDEEEAAGPRFSEPEVDLGLTEEDIIYLTNKWGRSYKQSEWVWLEQLYEEMMASYDIQTAGHKDTLKKLCKTSLKAEQLLDLGDVDGAQKMLKAYDALMKSGKFAAIQNKTEEGDVVDSFSALVEICEREGFIPKYYVDGPQDRVDRVLEDMQRYTRSLVVEELGLGNLIENAIKQIAIDKENETNDTDDIDIDEEDNNTDEDELFNYDTNIVENEDIEKYNEFLENLNDEDREFLDSLIDEEDEEYGS